MEYRVYRSIVLLVAGTGSADGATERQQDDKFCTLHRRLETQQQNKSFFGFLYI
jgi:hypothetical protein